MLVLGISAYYHDSAAALVRGAEVLAAAQEERFSRVRHDAGFPRRSIEACLAQAAVSLRSVDRVVFYEKPFVKFERLLETYLAFAPRGFGSFRLAMPVWLREKLFLKTHLLRKLREIDPEFTDDAKLLFSEHHLSHAASAFFPSPFVRAAVLTMDGVGEWATTSLAVGDGNTLEMRKEIRFPHSIGLLYSAFTYYMGFKVNSGEYKVMGLAPYGRPIHVQTILDHLIDLKDDGTFHLNMEYMDYCTGLTMTSGRFDALFGGPPRKPEERLTQREMDLAASIQAVTDEVVLRLARSAAHETGCDDLCLAGGVALNCVANGKVHRDGCFKRLWIQPAAGDAGGALGAALAVSHLHLGAPRPVPAGDGMKGAYLGPGFTQADVERRLKAAGAAFEVVDDDGLLDSCAALLADGKVLGWFQGRMEFGPRALGARSILGDARSPQMQSLLNLKVKFRESFRPFAPSVLREEVADWFELDGDSPYMLLTAGVLERRHRAMTAEGQARFGIEKLHVPRSDIPAATHVDYSARLQTVHRETNPRFHALLSRFRAVTGCPVLVNTSFNVRGEPIVCTPEDAFRCFMGTEIDALAIGNCLLWKERQDPALRRDYREQLPPD